MTFLIIIFKKRPHGLFLFLFLLSFLSSQNLEHVIVSKIIIEGNKKTKDYILLREIHHKLNEPVDTVKIINDKNLEYKAYKATGELYDKFTLQKRNEKPNLLIEALPVETRR